MFKNTKKLQQFYDEQTLNEEEQIYLSDKDRRALQKKAKKEVKRSGKKPNRNEPEW